MSAELIMQHNVQQRLVDMDTTIVLDVSKPAESVHKEADS
jgi:hypothetical protein